MADSPVQGASAGAWWKALTSKKNAKQEPLPSPTPSLAPVPSSLVPSSPDPRDQQPPQCSSEPKAADKPGSGGGSCRNLHVSRSGRFKERRKVHAPLLAESPALFEGGAPSRAAQQGQ
ncbi:PREDICTED: proline-rich protein 15 [Gavialis gangeticus]|uniref:proline-rich protein 15 n=1 Tax=Gavialis gangeticus TaxID=94835 RepID=UPI00092E79A9|nr:PREDICTED: proline-rich protein 15 [Gavialis gangeticus]